MILFFFFDTYTSFNSEKRFFDIKVFFSPTITDEYIFELPELYQDYAYQAIVNARYFWESWDHVTTKVDTIFVTDRPSFEKFLLTITPPKYSKLEKFNQERKSCSY